MHTECHRDREGQPREASGTCPLPVPTHKDTGPIINKAVIAQGPSMSTHDCQSQCRALRCVIHSTPVGAPINDPATMWGRVLTAYLRPRVKPLDKVPRTCCYNCLAFGMFSCRDTGTASHPKERKAPSVPGIASGRHCPCDLPLLRPPISNEK